ncbi:hypothetical protein [Streptomyces platensis]|uniref:hypothetical protein n=1 Tax=Streptomyces platensis TaxID=58346 RepID=UPI003865C2E4|nr:hypothetical protein OG962_30820 [Streptomyces platensis]
MPLDDTGVPGQGEAGDDSVTVAVDASGEGMEAGQVVLADGVEPLGEPVALALGEHLGEGPDVTAEGVEFGAVGQDGLELELFDLGAEDRPSGESTAATWASSWVTTPRTASRVVGGSWLVGEVLGILVVVVHLPTDGLSGGGPVRWAVGTVTAPGCGKPPLGTRLVGSVPGHHPAPAVDIFVTRHPGPLSHEPDPSRDSMVRLSRTGGTGT